MMFLSASYSDIEYSPGAHRLMERVFPFPNRFLVSLENMRLCSSTFDSDRKYIDDIWVPPQLLLKPPFVASRR